LETNKLSIPVYLRILFAIPNSKVNPFKKDETA